MPAPIADDVEGFLDKRLEQENVTPGPARAAGNDMRTLTLDAEGEPPAEGEETGTDTTGGGDVFAEIAEIKQQQAVGVAEQHYTRMATTGLFLLGCVLVAVLIAHVMFSALRRKG